eukprot:754490-Hanusia_phi.AAC.4
MRNETAQGLIVSAPRRAKCTERSAVIRKTSRPEEAKNTQQTQDKPKQRGRYRKHSSASSRCSASSLLPSTCSPPAWPQDLVHSGTHPPGLHVLRPQGPVRIALNPGKTGGGVLQKPQAGGPHRNARGEPASDGTEGSSRDLGAPTPFIAAVTAGQGLRGEGRARTVRGRRARDSEVSSRTHVDNGFITVFHGQCREPLIPFVH